MNKHFLSLFRRIFFKNLLYCALFTLFCGLFPFIAVAVAAAAEGVSSSHTGTAPLDFLRVPQDTAVFAAKIGPDKPLMTAELQATHDARSNRLFFGPWQMARPSVKAKQFQENILKKPRGYHLDTPWTAQDWALLHTNIQAGAYPTPQGPAIVVRHTDLRAMPTHEPLHLAPTPTLAMDFFDFFQYASLPLGTPVYVSHTSRDGQWLYIEYPLLTGWVRSADVAPVSRSFIKNYMNGNYAVVVRDNLRLVSKSMDIGEKGNSGADLGTSHVGAIFPLAHKALPLEILVPVRGADGTATVERVRPAEGSVQPKPMPLTPGALARLGNEMLGQPYAWGGSGQNRDCSLAMRDLFLPFGLWLARNSRFQVNSGSFINVEKLSPEARLTKIVREAVPFMTLLGFPGHVGLYVGSYEGQPVMLHNILGLRTGNEEEMYRRIIGRCILSTLEVGKDVPEMQLEESLLERLRSVRTLP